MGASSPAPPLLPPAARPSPALAAAATAAALFWTSYASPSSMVIQGMGRPCRAWRRQCQRPRALPAAPGPPGHAGPPSVLPGVLEGVARLPGRQRRRGRCALPAPHLRHLPGCYARRQAVAGAGVRAPVPRAVPAAVGARGARQQVGSGLPAGPGRHHAARARGARQQLVRQRRHGVLGGARGGRRRRSRRRGRGQAGAASAWRALL